MVDLPVSSQFRMQALGSHETGYQPRSAILADAMSEASVELSKLQKIAGLLSVQRPALEHSASLGTLHLPSAERLPPHGDEEFGRELLIVEPLKSMAAERLPPHAVEELGRTVRQGAVVAIRKLRTHHGLGLVE